MLSRVSDAIVSFTTTLKLDLVTCFPGEEVDSEKVSELPSVLHLVNYKATGFLQDSFPHPSLCSLISSRLTG